LQFSLLALDFDGTIAQNDRLEPAVREAIAELRARDILVAIVTGRILADLRRVVGELHFVDAVVAENGAVIAFPASGHVTVLGEAPPPAFLAALRQAGVALAAGQSIVDVSASDAPAVLAAVQRLELPLALVFNRGRLMILPQAISKATGLSHALKILRVSPHNALAIGDAENDHELLKVCEVGVAVGWGSKALQQVADEVLPGKGPDAVAGFLRRLGRELPVTPRVRRRLLVGHADDGQELSLAVRGRNVLIAGDSKSGKSWVTGLLCEQLILQGYCLCIIDPEGDYSSLEGLPGVMVFGGGDPPPRPRELLRALRHSDVSVIIDLCRLTQHEKVDYMRSVLPGLMTLRRCTGLPHRIVVDEAHYFLHDADVSQLIDLELHGYTLVTYRASQLHPQILAASEAVLATRESDPREVRGLVELCRGSGVRLDERDWQACLGNLRLGEVMVMPVTAEATHGGCRVRLAPRLTPHVRHLGKYIDIPVPESRAFVLAGGAMQGRRVRTLSNLLRELERTPWAVVEGHLKRHDFSRWIADVFGDHPLAEDVRRLELQPLQDAAEVQRSLSEVVRARYAFVKREA
jgi:hydroxymethylpyrimidine pyrophosphatase-like HAD family hydrolase